MSSVTFSTAVGGDGSTVTDDNNATTGLREGGWKTRFIPCFTQQVAVANYIVTKAGEASTSASNASASATAAAASYDSFDDRYLGAKTSDPTLDNDGNALLTGALYWNSSSSVMKVWSGSAWVSYNPAISYLPTTGGTMTGAITFAAGQTISGYLPTTGGTMTGAITFAAGQTISGYLPTTGGTMTGNIAFNAGQPIGTPSSGTLTNCTNLPIAAGTTGTLPISRGGTNSTATPTSGGIGYGTGTALAYTPAGTTGQVLTSNGASVPTWTTPSSGVSLSADNTWTGKQSFAGSTSSLAEILTNAAEVTTVSATAATGTINYDVTTQSVLYYTSNASANWTLNIRGNGTTSLNTLLATGQSITVAFLVTQGATAYYASALTIDGTSVTPKYQGGTAWSAGNASGIDAYVYTIIKTDSGTFTVIASQTQYK